MLFLYKVNYRRHKSKINLVSLFDEVPINDHVVVDLWLSVAVQFPAMTLLGYFWDRWPFLAVTVWSQRWGDFHKMLYSRYCFTYVLDRIRWSKERLSSCVSSYWLMDKWRETYSNIGQVMKFFTVSVIHVQMMTWHYVYSVSVVQNVL